MRVALIGLIIVVSHFAYGQDSTSRQILFSIRKSPVYADEFIYLYKKNHPKPEDFTEAKIEEYLTLFTNFKLKIAEGKKRGLDTTRSFIKEFDNYKDELRKPYTAGADDLDRITRETYARLSREIKAAHILISVRPDAAPSDTLTAYEKISGLRKRATQGEDFEKLAQEFSEDPSAKTNGGVLNYFTALQMVFPFEEAAYATKVGEISQIVRTRFGYHLVKVIAVRPATGEVEISHILLRANKGNDTKVRNTIFEIYDQLRGGRKWDDLCKEYSEDVNTKNSGGRLKPFGVGAMASVPEFEKMAFSLKNPGDYSDPFQSTVGWHIIRLEKKIPLQPYKEVEATLKRKVARDERLSLSKAVSFEKRKKELGFTEDTTLKSQILAMADSTLTGGKWHYAGDASILEQTLFTVRTDKTTPREFFSFISGHITQNGQAPAAYMKQLYGQFVEMKVNEQEEKKLVDENPEYRMLLNEYKEGILLFDIMEKEVWNKASEDTAGQRKYYQQHLEKFKAGNRVEARIFATPEITLRDEIRSKINVGDTLKEVDMKRFKSVTNWKNYERGESQIIDRISWVPGILDAELNGTYYLVEVARLIPPGTKSLEDARAGVISGYQDTLEKEWLVRLRKNYPVHINKKGKIAVIAALKR